MSISILNHFQLNYLIENYDNDEVHEFLKGKYLLFENSVVVAVDNKSGDAFTEEFSTIEQAIAWLNEDDTRNEYIIQRIDTEIDKVNHEIVEFHKVSYGNYKFEHEHGYVAGLKRAKQLLNLGVEQ